MVPFSFAELADTVRVAAVQDGFGNAAAEVLVAGMTDPITTKSLLFELEQRRRQTAMLGAAYKLILALRPIEAEVRAMLGQHHLGGKKT